MNRNVLILLILISPAVCTNVLAGEVVKWVDGDGLTNFGNAQFAPAGQGELITIGPTNGMDPVYPSKATRRSSGGRMVTVGRVGKQQTRGFRGYYGRTNAGQSNARTTRTRGRR